MLLAFFLVLILVFSYKFIFKEGNDINVIIDGDKSRIRGGLVQEENGEEDKEYSINPLIKEDDIFLPLVFYSHILQAEVDLEEEDGKFYIKKDDKSIKMKGSSRLIEYNDGEYYDLTDEEIIINDEDQESYLMTYVSSKLVGRALGLNIRWDREEKDLYIDSTEEDGPKDDLDLEIISHEKDDIIQGETILQINASEDPSRAREIRYFLINKGETKGFIIAKGEEIEGEYSYTPKMEDQGKKILAAALYDENGTYIMGQAIPIGIDIKAEVQLKGLEEGQRIRKPVDLSLNTNFIPFYVKYEITNTAATSDDQGHLSDVEDPLGSYKWRPEMKDRGTYLIRAIAYDTMENEYYSEPVQVEVDIERTLTLGGVEENMAIDNSVRLYANRNFDVSETEYLMKDLSTGEVSTIANLPYGAYIWNPGPNDSGEKELFVRVVDRGKVYISPPIRVRVNGKARIILEGIGPEAVINEDLQLSVTSNVPIENLIYTIENQETGEKTELKANGDDNQVLYRLGEDEEGSMTIQAEAEYGLNTISSEKIDFKIYQGDVYGPEPIGSKDEFIPLVSELANTSYRDIGMSAALQTAQAILESGWGQSVPVDKYSGELSYNLFGIKGEANAGSVISNTWEVYNGETYRVDAKFRAYNNLEESWKDHKALLLNYERYQPFTQVMFDYTKGAWALKRAGYATDPNYPLKLINIINEYELDELDKMEI